jgi:hypothetical protein
VCDLENLKNEEAMTRVGSQRHSNNKTKSVWLNLYTQRNLIQHIGMTSVKIKFAAFSIIAKMMFTDFTLTGFAAPLLKTTDNVPRLASFFYTLC